MFMPVSYTHLLEKPDVTVIVCDASCLERNLNLVLQITEITSKEAVSYTHLRGVFIDKAMVIC